MGWKVEGEYGSGERRDRETEGERGGKCRTRGKEKEEGYRKKKMKGECRRRRSKGEKRREKRRGEEEKIWETKEGG